MKKTLKIEIPYVYGDTVYLMHGDRIVEGKVYSWRLEMASVNDNSAPVIWPIYTIRLPNCLLSGRYANSLFPTKADLIKSL